MKIKIWLKNIARVLVEIFENSSNIEKCNIPRILFGISRQMAIPCFYVDKVFQHLNQHR